MLSVLSFALQNISGGFDTYINETQLNLCAAVILKPLYKTSCFFTFNENTCYTLSGSHRLFFNLQSQFPSPFHVLQCRWLHHKSLIWVECGPMSSWQRRWCQLDNDKIASDLSGKKHSLLLSEVIYCSDVLKLCHALLGTLPFTLIGLATNCDRFHSWQTRSKTLETAQNASSHLDPIYFEAFSFSCEQCTQLLKHAAT